LLATGKYPADPARSHGPSPSRTAEWPSGTLLSVVVLSRDVTVAPTFKGPPVLRFLFFIIRCSSKSHPVVRGLREASDSCCHAAVFTVFVIMYLMFGAPIFRRCAQRNARDIQLLHTTTEMPTSSSESVYTTERPPYYLQCIIYSEVLLVVLPNALSSRAAMRCSARVARSCKPSRKATTCIASHWQPISCRSSPASIRDMSGAALTRSASISVNLNSSAAPASGVTIFALSRFCAYLDDAGCRTSGP
jgi:hypothetical protein